MASSPFQDHDVNERTRLLQEPIPSGTSEIYREGEATKATNKDEGEVGNTVTESLFRTEAILSGCSIGPESQKHTMFNGSHTYTTRSRKSSIDVSQERAQSAHSDQVNIDPRFLGKISMKQFWLIFGVILTSYFVACFDSTIMVSSHPVITSYFKSSNSASWLSTAFLLTSTSFQPIFGSLSDTIGRKRPFIFSLAVLLVGTIWCALAQNMGSFIFARAFCGLGAGGLVTMSSIVTSDLVPIEIRGIYQSYINLVFGVGSTSGAALGGWIADSLGWRWEFGIQVPTLVICLIVALINLPSHLGLAEGVEKKSLLEAIRIFDYQGSILLTTSTTFLILGLNLGGNIYPWTHPFVIVSLIIFAIIFPIFVYVEASIPNPIMPPNIFLKNPRAGIIFASFLISVISNAVTFNVPIFFQAVMLESATSSGLRLLIPSIAACIAGVLAGFLITWTKRLKMFLLIGACMLLIGCLTLSFLNRGWPNWIYQVLLVPNSVGQGLGYPTTFLSILTVSSQSEQAVVTSTLILWRSLGTVFGVSLSSLVLQNMLRIFLNQNVIGPERNTVIDAVRKSVAAIYDLKPLYQEQVRDSYAAALRSTFIGTLILSVAFITVSIFVRIPRLNETQKS
ncbi:putative transporter [Golovinomyces cichoracearum]|uniref:Putative transporter n=1 Tax=Golovinomyces cichoracearum TaxID=62708 RepID=A0A420HCH4_9PEZI|nr:putative transporter [Golovinomyces cichoracearum]